MTEFNANTPIVGLHGPSKKSHRACVTALFKSLHTYLSAHPSAIDVGHVTMLSSALQRLLWAPYAFADMKGSYLKRNGVDDVLALLHDCDEAVAYVVTVTRVAHMLPLVPP